MLAEVVRKGKYSDLRDPEDHVRLLQAQLGRGDTAQAEATIRDLERSMAGLDKTRMCTALSSALVHVKKARPTGPAKPSKPSCPNPTAARACP